MSKTSALLDDRNPRIITAGYRSGSVPATPATSDRPATLRLIRLTYHGACTALAAVLVMQARFLAAWLRLARPRSTRPGSARPLVACLFLARPRSARPRSTRFRSARPLPVRYWLARVLRRLGNLIFMASDEEAYWRGWTVERRHAGLSRRYRHPSFDTLTNCPHCRGLGITVAESLCVTCSGTGRVTIDQPPLPYDG